MNTRTEPRQDPWQWFLRGAAYIRGHPRFGAEERDRKLELAASLRELIAAAGRPGGDFRDRLDAVVWSLCDPGWPTRLVQPVQAEWLGRWGSSDEASLREALAGFARDEDFSRRLDRFAAVSGRHAEDGPPHVRLAIGSLLNFATDPASLPIVRPARYESVERRVGWEIVEEPAIARAYERHLEFARLAHSKLLGAGVPVEDMLDVQSLILAAANEALWLLPPDGFEARRRPAPPPRPKAPHYLSLAACLGFEAPYLVEWIEFHRLVGVEHFFLYNSGDREAQREILEPYVEAGIVTLHEWPVFPPQHAAFQDCVRRHREDSRWTAYLDADQFLFSPTGKPLPEVLAGYERWPGVGVNWVGFGPSGHLTEPAGLVTENYVLRASDPGLGVYPKNGMNMVVDPSRVVECMSSHYFLFDDGFAVDENEYPILDCVTAYSSTSRLQANHYFTHSVEEFRAKLDRPNASTGQTRVRPDIDRLLADERNYAVPDRSIQRWLPALRRAVARYSEGSVAASSSDTAASSLRTTSSRSRP